MLERSEIMARVRQRDTGPELVLRSALHRCGLRYRVNVRGLPGSPDLVLPKYRACVFVHGCFWHHHGCRKSTVPKNNAIFWEAKFRANVARDRRKEDELVEVGYRVLVVWECALIGRNALPIAVVVDEVVAWLRGRAERGWIGGATSPVPLPEVPFDGP